MGKKFYKLRGTSDTRSDAYFEKRMDTNIATLRRRTESTDIKVKEIARILKKESVVSSSC